MATQAPTKDTKAPAKKFDPNTLDPALRPVYQAMQAELTRKLQEAAKTKAQSESSIAAARKESEDLKTQVRRMELLVTNLQAAGGQSDPNAGGRGNGQGQGQRLTFQPVSSEGYDPFNPQSVEGLITGYFQQYHGYIENAWQQLWKSLLELQAYNFQVMRIVAKDPDVDIEKVVQAAPQYGHNLDMAYKALYESPKMYEAAKGAPKLQKELEEVKAKLKAAEDRGTARPGVLGGTTGPVPRSVAKEGKVPKTYAEVASTIDPESLVTPDGVTSQVAGTAGAGGQGEDQ